MLWGVLGVVMFLSGCVIHWCDFCQHKTKAAKAREAILEVEDGNGSITRAPIPYVMINA